MDTQQASTTWLHCHSCRRDQAHRRHDDGSTVCLRCGYVDERKAWRPAS